MSSKQRLASLSQLLTLRQQAMEEAMKALSQARARFNHSKQKQEQLLGYRQDYLGQLETLGDKGCRVGRLRNRIDFIAQLDAILLQLDHELEHLDKMRMNSEKKFQQARAQHEAVERLIARIRQKQAIQVARTEQKESDEYAQKQWYSRKS